MNCLPPPQFLSEPSKARALEGWGVLETSNLYLCLFFLHHQPIHLPQYIFKFIFYCYIEGCLKPPICIFFVLFFINQFICINKFLYLHFIFTLRGVWNLRSVSLFFSSFINQLICLDAFLHLHFTFTLRGVWNLQSVSLFLCPSSTNSFASMHFLIYILHLHWGVF